MEQLAVQPSLHTLPGFLLLQVSGGAQEQGRNLPPVNRVWADAEAVVWPPGHCDTSFCHIIDGDDKKSMQHSTATGSEQLVTARPALPLPCQA